MSIHPDDRKAVVARSIREELAAEFDVRWPLDVSVVVTAATQPANPDVLAITAVAMMGGVRDRVRVDIGRQAIIDRINWPENFGPDSMIDISEVWV